MSSRTVLVLSIVGVAILTALAIYLTPLRHFTVLSPSMNEVDPAVFYEEYKKNPDEYIFIDVRSPTIYHSAHAKGSINVPIENLFDEHYLLPRHGKKIALICTTGRLAAIAYGYLQNWGFGNLIHIQGGMQNWAGQGLPVEGSNVFVSEGGSSDDHQ